MAAGEHINGFLRAGIRKEDSLLPYEMNGLPLAESRGAGPFVHFKIASDGEKNLFMSRPGTDLAAGFPRGEFAVYQIAGVSFEVPQTENILAPEIDGPLPQGMDFPH